jgi:uncharacterized protein (TIGR02246 family)
MRIMVVLLSALYLKGPCMSQTPSPSPHNASAAGIEKLHQADVAATLARDVEALTALWDADAVLLQPGQPAVVGKSAFRELIKQSFAESPSGKVLKYVPEIRDVQIAGDVAYEWGYFDSTFRPSDQEQPVSFRAKFVRVLKQQADGSWRFTRIIWTPE